MTENGMMSPADYAAMNGGSNRDGMFGGDGAWWIILFLLFGWGRNGNGGFGGGSGCGCEIANGFATNNIQQGITAIQQGICDSTYALTNALNGGFNGLSAQLAECCCGTQRAIDGVNYNISQLGCDLKNTMNFNTRDIIDNQNANSRAILDFLTQSKIDALRDENQALRFQASQSAQNAFFTANQDAQTAELIRRLRTPDPVPAYQVPNPNCCNNGYNYGGCGCGCGA